MIRVGAWCVDPASGEISRDGETARLEVRTMRLLLCLAERRGEVVSIDDLLKHVWPEVIVTPDSVYQAVASLRRVLGDDPRQPTYIATVPRLGYRMVAAVGPWLDQSSAGTGASVASGGEPAAAAPRGAGVRWAAAAALCLVLVVAFLFSGRVAGNRAVSHGGPPLQKSVAVLPFLDLTENMKEEEFADGITEELIDKLGRIPGFRVPPPTASFYFKGQRRSIADIGRALDVAYVLDGSTRKSGNRLRVAARLIRADNGVVVWSESYDRPWGDILTVQDDIAGEVTKSLRAAIESEASR
jgi:transcriptional activator of cad operon